jgi:hypothetical protein
MFLKQQLATTQFIFNSKDSAPGDRDKIINPILFETLQSLEAIISKLSHEEKNTLAVALSKLTAKTYNAGYSKKSEEVDQVLDETETDLRRRYNRGSN